MIRKALQADMDQVAGLCLDHALFEQSPLSCRPDADALGQAVSGTPPALHAWVVEMQQRVAGFASGSLGYSTWHGRPQFNLDCVFLAPQARGQGLGADLMAHVQRFAADTGCRHVEWVTPTWNARAIAFYRHLGAQGQRRLRFRSMSGLT